MTEAAPVVAASAAPAMVPITSQQAATMLAEKRAAGAATNPSDAARILGQRAAEARKERQAEAARTQEAEAVEADAEQQSEDKADSAPDAETANESPSQEQGASQADPDESQEGDEGTIDLGDGVALTKQEIRDGILMRAQFTKSQMALADERKQLESKFTQRLSDLDKTIASLEPMKGQVKTRAQFIEEFGYAEGLDKWDEHTSRVNAAKQLAQHTKSKAQQEARAQAEQDCDRYLVENYNKEWADPQKYEAAQVAISKHARSLGFTSEQILALGVLPGALMALHDSLELKSLKEKGGEIKRTIADKPKVTRPGAKVSAQAGAQSAAQTARAALKSSGSLKDAVAYLQAQRKARA